MLSFKYCLCYATGAIAYFLVNAIIRIRADKEEMAALTGSILALKILTDTNTREIFEEYGL